MLCRQPSAVVNWSSHLSSLTRANFPRKRTFKDRRLFRISLWVPPPCTKTGTNSNRSLAGVNDHLMGPLDDHLMKPPSDHLMEPLGVVAGK